MLVDKSEDTDGIRTAPGGYLDSGKCLAYRCFWGRRCHYDQRQRGSGDRASEQRVLRASAIGRCVAKRIANSCDVDADHIRTHYLYPELVRPELVRPELARPELARPELARTKLIRPELARTKLIRPELARTKLIRPEFARTELLRPEFANAD
jgi:hypothetical protein